METFEKLSADEGSIFASFFGGSAEIFAAYRSWYGFFIQSSMPQNWPSVFVDGCQNWNSLKIQSCQHTHVQDLLEIFRGVWERSQRNEALNFTVRHGLVHSCESKIWVLWLKNSRNSTDSFPSAWCCKSVSSMFFNISHSRRRHTVPLLRQSWSVHVAQITGIISASLVAMRHFSIARWWNFTRKTIPLRSSRVQGWVATCGFPKSWSFMVGNMPDAAEQVALFVSVKKYNFLSALWFVACAR